MLTKKFIPFILAAAIHAIPMIYFLYTPSAKLSSNDSVPLSHAIDLKGFQISRQNANRLSPQKGHEPIKSEAIAPGDATGPTQSGSGTDSDSAPTSGATYNFNGPQFIRFQEPVYPVFAREKGYEGKVKIRAYFDQDGAITKVDVVDSSGIKMLDDTVKNTAESWRLSPGSAGSFEKTFEFKLKN